MYNSLQMKHLNLNNYFEIGSLLATKYLPIAGNSSEAYNMNEFDIS